jgi:hypothetical protein
MIAMNSRTRLALLAGYVGLFALALALLHLLYADNGLIVRLLVIIPHSLPLLLTKFIEDAISGGPGGAFGAWIYLALVAVLWWPLLIVPVVPRLWSRPRARRLVIVHLAWVLALTAVSATWLALDPGLLAS